MKIKIKKEDIFDYVVGNSSYDAIEKQIDPTRYEVFDCGIYDNNTKTIVDQDEVYVQYCKHVSNLRANARADKMSYQEIERICQEIEEIAPTEIKL